MTRVYLAAPYDSRNSIRAFAADLIERGIIVTSSWLQEPYEINAGSTGPALSLDDDTVNGHATDDFADVSKSDVLVLFTEAYVGCRGGGGRHVETGYALAKNIPVVVIGEPENIFHRLASVKKVESWPEAVSHLVSLKQRTDSQGLGRIVEFMAQAKAAGPLDD